MTESISPSRHDEAYRYSDIDALSRAWPTAREDFVVAEGGEQSLSIVNTADAADVVVRHLAITLEAGARCDVRVLNAGGRLGRIVIDVTCHAGSAFTLGTVQLAAGAQTAEIVTTVRHAEPGATSHQLIRTIVARGATGSYLGKVEVARGADGTDSEQDAKAMLLDRQSTANAVPQLEIFADDVKCAHGASVGELDPMGLYYLQSRGIPPAEAKKLMLQAFVAGVFENDAALAELALAKLGDMV